MKKEEFDNALDEAILRELGYRREGQKFKFLADPKNKKTMSRLTLPQIKGMKLSYMFQSFYGIDVFRKSYDELADAMISHKGLGRGEVIDYEKASATAMDGSRIGVFQSPYQQEREKKKRFWHRGKKVESSE